MYPTTKFNIIDSSAIASLPVDTITDGSYQVYEMCGFSSDIGPEDYRTVSGSEFFTLYGSNISFRKHGQPLLQAAMAINAGAKLYCKRIVAKDAALANVGVVAVIEQVPAGAAGNTNEIFVLYYKYLSIENLAGEEYEYNTTEHRKSQVQQLKEDFIKQASIKLLGVETEDGSIGAFDDDYYAKAITTTTTTITDEDGTETTSTTYTLTDGKVYFPLFVIADNGRGESNKSFSITPDYSGSKFYQFIKYQFEIKNSGTTIETINFALDPSTSYDDENLSIETAFRNSTQLRAKQYASIIEKFITVLSEILGISYDDLTQYDILKLKNTKKKDLAANVIVYADSETNSALYTYVTATDEVAASTSTETKTDSFPTVDADGMNITLTATGTTDVASISAVISTTIDDTTYTNTIALPVIETTDDGDGGTVETTSWTASLENISATYLQSQTLSISYTIIGTDENSTAYTYKTTQDVASDATEVAIELDTTNLTTDTDTFEVLSSSSEATTTAEEAADTEESESTMTTIIEHYTITDHNFLGGGGNGDFGACPIEAETYNRRMKKVFDGTYSYDIYDLDNVKIDVIVDANYSHGSKNVLDSDKTISNITYETDTEPDDVKSAIQKFVMFREDCLYFADMGTEMYTLERIEAKSEMYIHDKFTALYHNSYDIIDPYSHKQITVTIGYHIAQLLVNHFSAGRNRPFAGILYGVTLDDVVEGTINFVPTNTPYADNKEDIDDLRVNYASYYDGTLVIETLYTFQENYTQFSFLNNILIVQNLIKDIRSECPKIRYSFFDGDDLTSYKNEVQRVITKHAPNYLSVSFEYVEDDTYMQNKIFYGAIEVKFRNFIQSEIFKITAIG